MNKRTLVILSSVGFIIGCLSGVFSYVFFKRITLEAMVLPFILLLWGVSFPLLKEKKKKASVVFFSLSVLIGLIARGILSYVIHRATMEDILLYVSVGILPYTVFLPLFFPLKKERKYLIIGGIIISAIFYNVVLAYSVRYIYLYEWVSDWDGYKSVMVIGALAILLSSISKLLFDTKRNYLTYLLLLIAGICFGIENSIRLGSVGGIMGILKGTVSSPLFATMLFSLIILIFMETEERKIQERRNIIFKDIVYQEVKPIKKRKRAVVFEVPPNVPKFKNDFTLKREIDNKNNIQNDC